MVIYYTFFSISVERQLDRIYKYFHSNDIEVLYIDLKPEGNRESERKFRVVTEEGDYIVEIKRLKFIRVFQIN